jgi:hypothetical protein
VLCTGKGPKDFRTHFGAKILILLPFSILIEGILNAKSCVQFDWCVMTFIIALPNDEMSCIIIHANKDVYLHESQTTRCLGVKGPAEGRSGPEALDGVRRCDVACRKLKEK